MKRSIKMVLLLAVLAVLVGGYMLLQQRQTVTSSVTEEEGSFSLLGWQAEEIAALYWESDGETFAFERTDGIWQKADDADFPVDQSALDALADDVAALAASRRMEDVSDPADYGLGEPAFSLTVTGPDGASVTLAQGDETPFADGYYVSTTEEDGILYVATKALSGVFIWTITDLAQMEEIPAAENVTRLTLSSAIDITQAQSDDAFDPDQRWFDTQTGEPLDSDAVDALVSAVQSLTWGELVSVNATDEELEAWGLDDAHADALILFDGDEAVRTLLLGTYDTYGDCYARLPDSRMVYTVDDLSDLMGAGLGTLWQKQLMPLAYEEIESAVFTLADGRTATAAPAADAEEEATDAEADEAADSAAQAQEALYDQLAGISGTTRLEGVQPGEKILTVLVTAANGQTRELSFYAYDADAYLVPITEESAMLVSADAVDRLARMIRLMD